MSFQSIGELKSLKGLQFWFWSHDHIPPHFNVKKPGHWQIKVHLDTSTAEVLDWEYTFPKRRAKNFHGFTGQQERQLRAFVVEHRNEILKEWNEKVHISENLDHD